MNSFIAAFISSLIGFINYLLTNSSLEVIQHITEMVIDGKEMVIFELKIKEKEPVDENVEEENVDEVIAEEVKEEVMKSQTESERTEKLRDKVKRIVKCAIEKLDAETQNEQISEQSAETEVKKTEVKVEEKKEEKKEEKVEVKTEVKAEEKKEEVDDEIEETFGDYQDEIINFRIDFEGDINEQITYLIDICDAAQTLNKNENINLSIEEFADILYCIERFYHFNPSFYRHLLMKFVGRISNIYRRSRQNWTINPDTVDFGIILQDCCPEDEGYLDSYINACKWFLNKTSGMKCWKKESRQKFGSWLREID